MTSQPPTTEIRGSAHPALPAALERHIATLEPTPATLAALSDYFNRGDSDPAVWKTYFSDSRVRKAYIAYYLPMTALKVQFALAELGRLRPEFFSRSQFRLTDFGAGPLSGLFGFATYFLGQTPSATPPQVSYSAFDRNFEIMGEAFDLFRSWNPRFEIEPMLRPTDILDLGPGDPESDGIFILNLLSELLPHGASAEEIPEAYEIVIRRAIERLAPGGVLLIIEPALKRATRRLHHLHDWIQKSTDLRVLAPCTHDRPCPLVSIRRDWCHEVRRWNYPGWFQRLDARLGHRNSRLLYSFLLLEMPGSSLKGRRDIFRVISEPMATKGKHERILCGDLGRFRATLLKRHGKSPSVCAFSESTRGDVLEIEGAEQLLSNWPPEREWRLTDESRVRRLARLEPSI